MTVATRLASMVRDAAGIELPVRIRAWDGSEGGPGDGPMLVIHSRRGLRRILWAPGELGLARAYVSGDVDVDGDLAVGFRQARHSDGPMPTSYRDKMRAVVAAARL